MLQTMRTLLILALALGLAACTPRRPDFSIDLATDELATAFGVETADVSVLSEGPAPELQGESRSAPEFWVDFKVPSFRQTLQARFVGGDSDWSLEGVRRRPRGNKQTNWSEVGEMLGEVRAAASERAEETEEIIRELASAIEAQAVDAGNTFARTDIKGLARLLQRGKYIERWDHSEDGWGSQMHYYASQAGDAYILVSRGADNRFDVPLDNYNAKTDAGDFTYEGTTSDPSMDLIFATGSFVQRYEPGE